MGIPRDGSFECGHCEWNADGTIKRLKFDCPVHAPQEDVRRPKFTRRSYYSAINASGVEVTSGIIVEPAPQAR